MKLKPVHDKIIVKPKTKEEENMTESGILLPDSTNNGQLHEGEVIAAGNVIYSTTGDSIPIVVEKGDRILYQKHGGILEYNLDGEELLIMSQNEVLSILENN